MSELSRGGWRACIVAATAILLLVGALLHPYVMDESNPADVAAALAAGRIWFWSHVLLLMGLAGLAGSGPLIAQRLEGTRGGALGALGAVLVVPGTGLASLIVGGEGIGGYWSHTSGADVAKYAGAIESDAPIFLVGLLVLLLGLTATSAAVWRSGLLSSTGRFVTAAGLVAGGAGAIVPFGWGTYVLGVGLAVGLLPIASNMWNQR